MEILRSLRDITFDSSVRNANVVAAIKMGLIDKATYDSRYQPMIDEEICQIKSLINKIPVPTK